jgi:hypothetical protein
VHHIAAIAPTAIARRARTPRKNSCPTLPSTNAAQQNIAIANGFCETPAANNRTSVSRAQRIGARKFLRALAKVARRQAITGPMPLSSTRIKASGTV